MQRAQAFLMADGKRLHLQHGPIDLIIEAFGTGRTDAYHRAASRFETVLEDLVQELPRLRQEARPESTFSGPVAIRMQEAVIGFLPAFVTPMAAVAGSVADEILFHLCVGDGIDKAYANNGGDVAFHIEPGQRIDAGIAAFVGGHITLTADTPYRGLATSGWRGRSHSLGIADSVSVVARTAAIADVAATLIANAVDLPGSPRVQRRPANALSPDSDLGDRPVTVGVDILSEDEVRQALAAGTAIARAFVERGLIGGASLQLQGMVDHCGGAITAETPSYSPLSN